MSDLFGNHIVGFPTRWLSYCIYVIHVTIKTVLLEHYENRPVQYIEFPEAVKFKTFQ